MKVETTAQRISLTVVIDTDGHSMKRQVAHHSVSHNGVGKYPFSHPAEFLEIRRTGCLAGSCSSFGQRPTDGVPWRGRPLIVVHHRRSGSAPQSLLQGAVALIFHEFHISLHVKCTDEILQCIAYNENDDLTNKWIDDWSVG